MIALLVIVHHVLMNDIPKMRLPERDHSTQALPLIERTRRSAPLAGVVLLRHQLTMPAQNRVRSDNACHVCERLPADRLALHRQAPTLGVGEAQPPAIKLGAEDPVLLDEILHRSDLLAVQPASDGDDQALEGRAGHSGAAYCPAVPKLLRRRPTQTFGDTCNRMS